MSDKKEPTPIKTERIDNPDGTYILKEVYDTLSQENNILSGIVYYNKNNQKIGGKYYKDNKFKELFAELEIVYNSDNSTTYIAKYSNPTIKGWLSIIENYNKNDQYYSGKYFKDKNFKELVYTAKRIYNPDGSYIDKEKYTEPTDNGILSEIYKCDKNNKCYYSEGYKTNDFSEMVYTTERIYYDDGSHISKIKFTKPMEDGILSEIDKRDKDNKLYYSECYKTKDFKELVYTAERIYNNDCSYIDKFKYIKPNKDGWLSFIEHYNKDNQYCSGKYFKDKNFEELGLTQERSYNDDGSYLDKFQYTRPNKEGCLSEIDKFNKDGKLYSGIVYKEKCFKKPFRTIKRIYNSDGSYIDQTSYTEPNEDNIISEIRKFNNDGKMYYVESYKDKSFENLAIISKMQYNLDGSNILKQIYTEPSLENVLSIVQYFNNKGKIYYVEAFKDNNFKNKLYIEKYKYNEDGSYVINIQHTEEWQGSDGIGSVIIKSHNNDDLFYSEHYIDFNFKNLYNTDEFIYNQDGSYIYKIKYFQPNEDGFLSSIEYYNKDNISIKGIRYKDDNFKKIFYTITRKFINNNEFLLTEYTEPNENGRLSSIEKYDDAGRLYYGKYYKAKHFKDLELTLERTYNDDDSYTNRCIYTKPDKDGTLSFIEKYDNKDRVGYGEYYVDKDFKELDYIVTERTYNDDGSYSCKYIYLKPGEDGLLSSIQKYDDKNREYYGEYFIDKNYNELGTILTRNYNEDGSYTQKLIYSHLNKEGWLSCEQFFNKKYKITHSFAYFDNNFQKLYRKSYFKYLPNNNLISLREYKEKKDGYFSEIEKYDNDSTSRTLIYKRQYKFKGLLAKIIFNLSR